MLYIGHSKTLDRSWLVQARDVEDATGKVLSFCHEDLEKLEASSPNKNIDIDLSFKIMEEKVLEL